MELTYYICIYFFSFLLKQDYIGADIINFWTKLLQVVNEFAVTTYNVDRKETNKTQSSNNSC